MSSNDKRENLDDGFGTEGTPDQSADMTPMGDQPPSADSVEVVGDSAQSGDVTESTEALDTDVAENAEASESDVAESAEALESDVAESAEASESDVAESAEALESDVAESAEALESDVAESAEMQGGDASDAAPDAPGTPPAPAPAAPTQEKKSGGSVLPGLFGGVAAAVVGFGSAQFLDVDWMSIRGGEDPVGVAITDQNALIQSQAETIAGLEAKVNELSAAVASPDLSSMEETINGLAGQVQTDLGSLSSGVLAQLGQVTESLTALSGTVGVLESRLEGVDGSLVSLEGGVAAVTDGLGAVDAQLSAVDERLVAVEKRPLVESSDTAKATFTAYEREVQRLTENLEAQKAESAEVAQRMAELAALSEAQITAVQEEAAKRMAAMQDEAAKQIEDTRAQTQVELEQAQVSVQNASVTAALIDLEKALEEGTPYADALSVIGSAGEVPEVLSANADAGVQTLSALRRSYPSAARAGLNAALKSSSTEEDAVGKFTSFFRAQTGARSLAPKDGADPDAVLSRAEAAVAAGDLETAVTEIETLPEAAQSAMSDWVGAASARSAAVTAASGLAASFATN